MRAVGIKISGKTMEATSTNGSVMVPEKFKLVTRMAAATLRCAVPRPSTLRTGGIAATQDHADEQGPDHEEDQRQEAA